jgi:hypothetical protein
MINVFTSEKIYKYIIMNKLCYDNIITISCFLNKQSIIILSKVSSYYKNILYQKVIIIKRSYLTKLISYFLLSKQLAMWFINSRKTIKLGLFDNNNKLSELKIYFCYRFYDIHKNGIPNHINIELASEPSYCNYPNIKILKDRCYINKNILTNIIYHRLKSGFIPIQNLSYRHEDINYRPWTRP